MYKNLGKIASIFSGGTPPTEVGAYWSGDINWFTPTEIGKKKYINDSNRKITTLGLEKSSANFIEKNNVLLSTRANIGDVAIAECDFTTNQGIHSIVANEEYTTSEYIYYFLSSIKRVLLKYSSGSTFLEISSKELKNIKINLPTIVIQNKITVILSSMDDLIQEYEELRDEYYKLFYEYLVSSYKSLTCEHKKLDSISTISRHKAKRNEENIGTYTIIDMGSISNKAKIIEKTYTNQSSDKLLLGDIVIIGDDIGGGHLLGMPAHIEQNDKYVVGDHVYKISDINCDTKFLKFYIQHYNKQKYFYKYANGTAQLNLQSSVVKNLKIKIPDLETQTQIADFLSSIDMLIEDVEQMIENQKLKKKYYLNKIFS